MQAGNPTALVTGAARRVGRAVALELSRAGYDVAIHFRSSQAPAAALQHEIEQAGRRAILVQGDLTLPSTASNIISQTVAAFGRLDVLVNNASIFTPMALSDFNLETWRHELDVNLTSVALLCHHAREHLLAGEGGCIINLCDILANRPIKGYLAYCVSKAGLECLTKALAVELAPKVRVNGIAPGIAVFPEYYDEKLREKLVQQVPLKRQGTPQGIAAAIRYLVVDAPYVTGQILNIDGGRSIV